ncbi:MAG: hypothetical protein PHG64_15305, partial [Paludibacter sp.]|nr:hypothetical protein [Paludibacter sp.]
LKNLLNSGIYFINLYKSNEILKEKKSVKVEKASPRVAERLLNLPVFTLGLVASPRPLTFSVAEDEAIRSYFLILIIRIVVSVTTVKLPMSSASFVLNSFSNTSILCQLLSLGIRAQLH